MKTANQEIDAISHHPQLTGAFKLSSNFGC